MSSDSDKNYLPPSHFVKHLEQNLFERHRPVKRESDTEVHYLDLTPLKLNVGVFVPFVIPTGLPVGKNVQPDQLDAVVEKLRADNSDRSRYFTVIVLGNRLIYNARQLKRNVGRHGIAVFDLNMLQSAYNAGSDVEALKRVIADNLASQLGPDRLSPYEHSCIAIGGRFFGRSDLLQRVQANRSSNFTFAGNRRIGKTSLMMEIRRQLRTEQVAVAWVYGNTCNSTYDVLHKIVTDLREDIAEQAVRDLLFLEKFPSLVHHIPDKLDRDVAIFVDEFDHILEFDEKKGNALLELLRGVSQHARVRIFFAGFRRTMAATRMRDHPLYNFGQNRRITGLSRNEITQMVAGPLSLLGVNVGNDVIVAIERETAGHPELIQICCQNILAHYSEHGEPPSAAEMLARVFEDEVFREKILGSFVQNFTPAEKLACYVLFRNAHQLGIDFDRFDFDLNDLAQLLQAEGVTITEAERNTLLNFLEVGGAILSDDKKQVKYRFAVPQLGRYCVLLGLDVSIEQAKQDMRLRRGFAEILLEEPQDGREMMGNAAAAGRG